MLKYVLAAMFIAGSATAQDLRWCASPRDRNCQEDIHLKARVSMEDKMHACMQIDGNLSLFKDCLDNAGWRGTPLFKDERFKPLIVMRK